MSRRRSAARDAEGSPLHRGDSIRSLDNDEYGVIQAVSRDPRGLPVLIVRGFRYPVVSPSKTLLMESRGERWLRAARRQ